MLMLLGTAPEVTQVLFRMGDSPTNVISPMSPYFALALGYLQKYKSSAGIGTLMSMTLPISITLLVGWFLFFMLWYALGIPLGPGVPSVNHPGWGYRRREQHIRSEDSPNRGGRCARFLLM